MSACVYLVRQIEHLFLLLPIAVSVLIWKLIPAATAAADHPRHEYEDGTRSGLHVRRR